MLTENESEKQAEHALDVDRPLPDSSIFTIEGHSLTVEDVNRIARSTAVRVQLSEHAIRRMQPSVQQVQQAVERQQTIYGVTTGFGGLAGIAVNADQAAASQQNLLSFLATAAGAEIDPRHTRAAMLLRANVLAQGCSGVRPEIAQRLLTFLSADAIPVVRELGSIGASGDLVPLASIARGITGANQCVNVRIGDRLLSGSEALSELNLEPMNLLPKEGLALVNGTSFSAAVAASCVAETQHLMSLTMAVQAMFLQALRVQEDPFDAFVHQKKPHPGQVWSAAMLKRLLSEGCVQAKATSEYVQDRYSLRCFPQYMGSIVENVARIIEVVETEMNSVSDNPMIDVEHGRFCQSGNFLGQYIGVAMDDLRRQIGLMAKHLDVQLATLMAPEFNSGLPASLRGNQQRPYNMGLKGLQITANSIMPLLTWAGNPLVEHYPTHAEQFNQNINGLSWGAALQAWKSIGLYRHYLCTSLISAVQALDLRAHAMLGHYDGRVCLGSLLTPLYDAICQVMHVTPELTRPLLYDDSDLWFEQHLAELNGNLERHGSLLQAVAPIFESFTREFSS